MNTQPHIKRTLIHALLLTAAIVGFSAMASAQGEVFFKGRVLSTGASQQPVSMIVTDGTDTMDVAIGRNGQYEFVIPANERVSVMLASEGHITKQVTVDTHNAPVRKGRPHRVAFHMELQRQPMGMLVTYDGPIGRIAFDHLGKEVRTTVAPTAETIVALEESPIITAQL